MTEEERAFTVIKDAVQRSEFLELLGAHPPSGKSYYGDLITFRSPRQQSTGAERDHVDLIFCSEQTIYLCEIKGRSSQSGDDIQKLYRLQEHYGVEGIVSAVRKRLSWSSRYLSHVGNVVKCIGCETLDQVQDDKDILYIQASRNNLRLRGHKADDLSTYF